MVQSPIVSLFGPRDRWGWAIRYVILALLVVGTVFAHDVIIDEQFHGDWAQYLGNIVMISLPLYAVATGVMADMGRLRKALIVAAETDQMTGLLQRPAFIKAVNRRLSQTGVLMMVDIDGLAQINAKHDHHAGDLCLMALGIRLREVTRKTDIIGRIDGAKIAAYVPGASLDVGMQLANRIAEGIQVATGETRFDVSVSVGVVMADGQTPLSLLLKSAEDALLRAKARGPSQVMMSDRRRAA
ncbi:MAG: GGDEF domain-containing protein [Pseudomonadota bacterium]